jgi:hypothetical protein
VPVIIKARETFATNHCRNETFAIHLAADDNTVLMNFRSFVVLFPSILLCAALVPEFSSAQAKVILTSNVKPDTARLHQQLFRSVHRHSEATLLGERQIIDSLSGSASTAITRARTHLSSIVDSLILAARDSLDAPRQDSLHLVGTLLTPRLTSIEPATRQILVTLHSVLANELSKAGKRFSDCEECESNADFDSRFADFKEFTDSLLSAFHDTTSSVIDNQRDLILDTHDTVRDSLFDARDYFIDNRLNDIDVWRYRATRLVVSSGYSTHNSFRGRDNGLVQQVYSPSVTFRHSSGLSVQASTYWLSETPKSWDDFQLVAGYDFRFNEIAGASLSYTHFWFSDSSRSQLSVFTDNAQGGISFDWPALSLAALGSMNFGTASEFTLTTSISHDFVIPLSLYNQITIEPTVSSVIGGQNSQLTTLRTTLLKRRTVVTTQHSVTNSFGILDYEISLPATIEIGPVSLAPAVTYIIPFNIVDASSRKSFVDIDFSISLIFR